MASTLTSLKKSLGKRRSLAVGATKLAQQLVKPLCQLTAILMTLYLQAGRLVGKRHWQTRSLPVPCCAELQHVLERQM